MARAVLPGAGGEVGDELGGPGQLVERDEGVAVVTLGGRPAITSFRKLVSSLRPVLGLRRQGVEPRRPLPLAGRVRRLLHDIPAPRTMD